MSQTGLNSESHWLTDFPPKHFPQTISHMAHIKTTDLKNASQAHAQKFSSSGVNAVANITLLLQQ